MMCLMRRRVPFVLLIAVVGLLAGVARAQEPPSVRVAKVDGSIDRTLSSYLLDSIEDAERSGSTLVLQLDSAGTLDEDPIALARRIHDATVPVIVWVGPAPARAAGAGLLFMYAASVGAVAPGAGVGPLEPLDLAGGEPPISRAELEKLIASWASEHGRAAPTALPDAPVPAQSALDRGIASVVAVSITELLTEVDGMTVATANGTVELRTRIATGQGEQPVTVRFTDLGPIDRVLHAAASPTWIYVLLLLGLAGIAFETTQPGFGFAGFSGLAMLALAVYGLAVVPFSVLGLALLLLGVILLTLDVRLRRLGPVTLAGMVSFVAGSLVIFGGISDEIDVSPWLIGSFAVAAFLYWGFGLTVAIQSRERLTSTQRGLVGLIGETRGELKPEGPVFVKGALWRGRSANGPIAAGSRVRVRGVDGLILKVEPAPGRAPGSEQEEPPPA